MLEIGAAIFGVLIIIASFYFCGMCRGGYDDY
jgi:hypothetical protein